MHGGAFYQPAGGFALAAGCTGLLGALPGAFVLDVADGQPEQLDDGVVVGEMPAVLDDLPELVVQRLDAVGGVDDPAQFRGKARNGMNRSQAFLGVLQVATAAG